ncbi:hypothetical protein MVEN_01797900 [Mycena venus]|uniref:Uncharacterized protein n=1 Tax=Mycena venus TaxID=2733690 RepID=A0A8H6XKD5_9AGAR|nr:hypothetical protein MVEN_01797900 [Mycena venus]
MFRLTVQKYKDWKSGRFAKFQALIWNLLMEAFDSSLETWNHLPFIRKLLIVAPAVIHYGSYYARHIHTIFSSSLIVMQIRSSLQDSEEFSHYCGTDDGDGAAFMSTVKSYISMHGFQYSKLLVLAFLSHYICVCVVKAFTRFRGYGRAKATRFQQLMVEPLVAGSLVAAPVAIVSSSKIS